MDITNTFKDSQGRARCRSTRSDGGRCGSPALRGTTLCYFHSEQRGTPDQVRDRRARHHSVIMPQLRTREDIQLALSTALSAIAGGDIDPRRAGLILYCLQIASSNITQHQDNFFRELPHAMQYLADDAAQELASQQQSEAREHYGTGPTPEFAPDGGPISTTPDYVSAERKAYNESLPSFSPRPGQWTKLENAGPNLLEALGRHYSNDTPLPGSPEDRKATNPEHPSADRRVDRLREDHQSEDASTTNPQHIPQTHVIAAMQASKEVTDDTKKELSFRTMSERSESKGKESASLPCRHKHKPSPPLRVPHVSLLRRGFAGSLIITSSHLWNTAGCPIHAVSPHEWAFERKLEPLRVPTHDVSFRAKPRNPRISPGQRQATLQSQQTSTPQHRVIPTEAQSAQRRNLLFNHHPSAHNP